ncbi:MAG: hypothetical protein NUV90_00700 [Candidatus Parcubacteria bacterium]|nr:hypothetical protein [Candidatus Parcubacteria bacterium]
MEVFAMKKITRWIAILASISLFGLISGCATDIAGTIKKDPAALHGDYSGKDLSGAFAVIRAPGDIPHLPASNGKRARLSQIEIDQILYLDADCQAQLFEQLPGWAQAVVKEGGWGALATGIGEWAFASYFPGAVVSHYLQGGAVLGAVTGANSGRSRQETSAKGAQAYCVILQLYETKNRYPGTLPGINVVPWYGNGDVGLQKSTNATTDPTLSPVRGNQMPPP